MRRLHLTTLHNHIRRQEQQASPAAGTPWPPQAATPLASLFPIRKATMV